MITQNYFETKFRRKARTFYKKKAPQYVAFFVKDFIKELFVYISVHFKGAITLTRHGSFPV